MIHGQKCSPRRPQVDFYSSKALAGAVQHHRYQDIGRWCWKIMLLGQLYYGAQK